MMMMIIIIIIIIYLQLSDAVDNSTCMGMINNEMEQMWKVEAMA